ncbi:MAG: TrmH family RNA methyltransferase [Candidatus Microsaccharimonas sp.]
MERITSAHNQLFKRFKQLATQAKARRADGQTIFEGVHVCESYLNSGQQPRYCIVSDSAQQDPEVTKLIFRLDDHTPIVNLADSLFHSMSSVEQGVGVAFVVAIPEPIDTPALAGDALLIDAVQDPGNLGALLRTAAAAGVKDVYLSEGSASAWAPKTIRAGMGAHMGMNIYERVQLNELVKSASVPVRATSLQATESLYQKDLTVPTAWIMGNEGAGVSDELIALCGDNAVSIPQDEAVESLNVAAAAAVCLFEQRRQRLV